VQENEEPPEDGLGIGEGLLRDVDRTALRASYWERLCETLTALSGANNSPMGAGSKRIS
jgi:hypothetical protein